MSKTKTPSFVLTLPLITEAFQEYILEKRLEIGRKIYNACISELYKRYSNIKQSKEYNSTMNRIKETYREESKIKHLNQKNGTKKKFNDKHRKELYDKLNKLYIRFGLSEYSLHEFVKSMNHIFKSNLDSQCIQQIASRAWKSMNDMLFGNGKKMYYKKYDELDSLEGKSNKQGIKYRSGYLNWNGLNIKVNLKANDEYAHMALTQRIKYCRVKRKFIRGKYKYYVQLIIEGFPPKKIDKETGMFKHKHGFGKVGIDTSLQVMAVSSENKVGIYELAPSIENIEREKRVLQRKLDRQRRSNNPHKFNEDGTIKRNNLKWIKSNNYIKTQNHLKELERKQADMRKMEHFILANEIIELGNEFYIEPINYKGLQVRSKETKVDKNGKYKSKKRYGKSIANKSPSMFIGILRNKLSYFGLILNEINTYKVKASQYNHITDEYVKAELNERWKNVGENTVQRDLYSSFLIMNVGKTLDQVDRDKCNETWDRFLTLHDKEIERLNDSEKKLSVL